VAGVCSTSKHPGLWVSRLGSLIEKKEKERKTEKLAGEGGRECVWEGEGRGERGLVWKGLILLLAAPVRLPKGKSKKENHTCSRTKVHE